MKKLLVVVLASLVFTACQTTVVQSEKWIVQPTDNGLYEVVQVIDGEGYVVEYNVTYEDAIAFINGKR